MALIIKTVICIYLISILYMHFRGRERLPLLRQLVNHSSIFAPYNALMYLFSSIPAKPYLDRDRFPELDVFKENWEVIRDEGQKLFEEGYIRDALHNNEAGFGSFFKKGWTRFYLTWYDGSLPSAVEHCPKTLELLSKVPNVKGAMFTMLPPHSHLNRHRDPYGGSIRYHLGLDTPNSADCYINVDGERYAWHNGDDVVFDETYVHWVRNDTDHHRLIFFCDVERPLRSSLLTRFNRWFSALLGRATAPQNVEGERVGAINRAYTVFIQFGNTIGGYVRQFKRAYPQAYRILKPVLAIVLVILLVCWLF